MTTKHTPGPWFIWEGGAYAGRPEVKKRGELRGYDAKICEIDDIDGTVRSRKANARLIAAAPDLLEALQVMVRDYGAARASCGDLEMSPALFQAQRAITKATGERE